MIGVLSTEINPTTNGRSGRNGSAPYGPIEWGNYNADLRKICCVTFLLPCDANRTASIFHNGVLAVQGTLSNASSVAGNLEVWPLPA